MSDDTQAGRSDATHKTLATNPDDTEGQSLNHKTLAIGSEDATHKTLAVGSEDATHKTLATDDDTEGQSMNHKSLATPGGDDPAGPSDATHKTL